MPLIESGLPDEVLGSPTLVTLGQTIETLNSHGFKWRGGIHKWDVGKSVIPDPPVQWGLFTFTAAIVYAAWRGATEIDVFGADWAGKLDLDGVEAGRTRSDERWKLERAIFGVLQIELGKKGVALNRSCPTAPSI